MNLQEKNHLHSDVKVCSKITGLPICSLTTVYEQQHHGIVAQILKASRHLLGIRDAAIGS